MVVLAGREGAKCQEAYWAAGVSGSALAVNVCTPFRNSARTRAHRPTLQREDASMTGRLPKPTPPSPQHILERAEKLLGRKQIADALKVSERVVETWCGGSATLSDSHLLRLAELLAKFASTNR